MCCANAQLLLNVLATVELAILEPARIMRMRAADLHCHGLNLYCPLIVACIHLHYFVCSIIQPRPPFSVNKGLTFDLAHKSSPRALEAHNLQVELYRA